MFIRTQNKLIILCKNKIILSVFLLKILIVFKLNKDMQSLERTDVELGLYGPNERASNGPSEFVLDLPIETLSQQVISLIY